MTDLQPAVLRQISTRAVMEALLHGGPTSRATLAKITGFSKQTTSEVIRVLEENGFVRVRGMKSGRVGTPAVIYEVVEEAGYVLGVDAGPTTVRAALATIGSRIVGEITQPADSRGGHALIAQIGALCTRILDEAKVDPARLRLVSVATPGVVDPRTGAVDLAYNVPDLGRIDVLGALRAAVACDVVVENDINAAAVGEYWRGNAKGAESLAFLSLGTGVGLGVLIDGKLLRGATGAAGEIAYLPIGADPAAPLSLDQGTLEVALGAVGITHRYRMAGGPADASVREILDRCGAGERAAVATIEESARIAALVIVSVQAVFDPAQIVLGGNIGCRPEMAERIAATLPQFTRRRVALEVSRLGNRATLIGTVAIGLNRLHNALFSPSDLPGRLGLPMIDVDRLPDNRPVPVSA